MKVCSIPVKFLLKLIADGGVQKKKRIKADSDISRMTTSVRNQLDALASLKGEQV